MEEFRQLRPKIQTLFADAKRELSKVSTEEWDGIPELGDHTIRRRKKVKTVLGYTPVPDNVLKTDSDSTNSTIMDDEDGTKTSLADLTQLGGARQELLNLNLKKMSDSVNGQTVVDPKGYLTDLSSSKITSETEIGDIKKG